MSAPDEDGVFDFAILGAGVSGLCLAWELARGPLADRRVLLVDGARDDDLLRTRQRTEKLVLELLGSAVDLSATPDIAAWNARYRAAPDRFGPAALRVADGARAV